MTDNTTNFIQEVLKIGGPNLLAQAVQAVNDSTIRRILLEKGVVTEEEYSKFGKEQEEFVLEGIKKLQPPIVKAIDVSKEKDDEMR